MFALKKNVLCEDKIKKITVTKHLKSLNNLWFYYNLKLIINIYDVLIYIFISS